MEIINDYENIVLMAWDEFIKALRESNRFSYLG